MHSSPGNTCPSPYHFTCFLEGKFLAPYIIFLKCLFTLPVPALLLGNPAPPIPLTPVFAFWPPLGQIGRERHSTPSTSQWAALLPGEDLSSGRPLRPPDIIQEGTNPLAPPSRGPARCPTGGRGQMWGGVGVISHPPPPPPPPPLQLEPYL